MAKCTGLPAKSGSFSECPINFRKILETMSGKELDPQYASFGLTILEKLKNTLEQIQEGNFYLEHEPSNIAQSFSPNRICKTVK